MVIKIGDKLHEMLGHAIAIYYSDESIGEDEWEKHYLWVNNIEYGLEEASKYSCDEMGRFEVEVNGARQEFWLLLYEMLSLPGDFFWDIDEEFSRQVKLACIATGMAIKYRYGKRNEWGAWFELDGTTYMPSENKRKKFGSPMGIPSIPEPEEE